MAHITPAPPDQLPSVTSLRRYAVIAMVAAIVIAITVVLPAEKGVDITGIGKIIGLKEMGDIKQEINLEATAESTFLANSHRTDSLKTAAETAVISAVAAGAATPQIDTTNVVIAAHAEGDVWLRMKEKEWAVYAWSTNGGLVEDDIRGDSGSTALDGYYRYHSGRVRASSDGAIVAKFDGLHGWIWKNETDSPITVTIVTRGNYTAMGNKR